MTFRSVAHGRWVAHWNAINPPRDMRDWLGDRVSLTLKLTARSKHFQVCCLHQRVSVCLADEFAAIRLPYRTRVHEREVLLQCDGVPVVYAHTIVPLKVTASDWPFFRRLGERSLGSTLFGDPRVVRGTLSFARLRADHPLTQRACNALGIDRFGGALYARRCLFRRKNGLLLVTEIFLPGIANLGLQGKLVKNTRPSVSKTDVEATYDVGLIKSKVINESIF